jgi:hypothetical protein
MIGDVRVSMDVDDKDDAEAQVVRMLAKVTSRVRKAYDVEDPF